MARITRMTKRRLGELLQAEGLISEDQIRQARDEQRKSNLFLNDALVKLGFVSEEVIAQTIVQQFSLPFLSAQQYTISTDVLGIFPERMYYEYQFIAVDKIGGVLLIIGAGLMNHDVLDELERLSNCRVCQFVSTSKDIRNALERHAKDLRKEQNLSSLGSLLLDESGKAGNSAATQPAVRTSGSKTGIALAPPKLVTSLPSDTSIQMPRPPGVVAAAAQPPASNKDMSSLGAMLLDEGPSAPPSPVTPGRSGISLTPPKLISALPPETQIHIPMSPASSLAAPSPFASQATPALGSGTPRISALTAPRGKTSNPNIPAVKETPAPFQTPPGTKTINGVKPPETGKSAPMTNKPGLLGLFKRQPDKQ